MWGSWASSAGHVVAGWEPGGRGPGRKYYAFTAGGRAFLAEQGLARATFVHTAQQLIDLGGPS